MTNNLLTFHKKIMRSERAKGKCINEPPLHWKFFPGKHIKLKNNFHFIFNSNINIRKGNFLSFIGNNIK